MNNLLVKSAIALAVTATTGVAIADTTMYGRARGGLVCSDADNTTCDVVNGSSRWGVKANRKLTDGGLTGIAHFEMGVGLDSGTFGGGTTNRLSYVGLKGGFGQVAIGSQWGPYYSHMVSPVDPSNVFGGSNSAGGLGGAIGQVSGFRRANSVTYKGDFGPVGLGVMAVLDGNGTDDVAETQIAASFGLGPVKIGLGMRDQTDTQTTTGVNVTGKMGSVSAGLLYQMTDRDAFPNNDVTSVLLNAGFGFGGGNAIQLWYGQDEDDGANNTPTRVSLEYTKSFKKFKILAGLDQEDPDTAADSAMRYGVGLRMDF